MSKTSKIIWTAGIFLAFVAILLCYAYFIEPQRLVVVEKEIKIKGWDPALNGFRIAMMSDLHAGSNGVDEAKIRLIRDTLNNQNADVIVLLGDYLAFNKSGEKQLKMPVETVAENLQGLSAPFGIYSVRGNHDDEFDQNIILNTFPKFGIRVLDDELVTINKNGVPLRIIGLRDHLHVQHWASFARRAEYVLKAHEQKGNVIVLEHGPDILPVITGQNLISPDLKLILAGHTHGGQVWLPILGRPIIPSSYGQKYAYGHVKDQGVDMYITSGVGTSNLPFRFMVPPEIVVLTITAE